MIKDLNTRSKRRSIKDEVQINPKTPKTPLGTLFVHAPKGANVLVRGTSSALRELFYTCEILEAINKIIIKIIDDLY